MEREATIASPASKRVRLQAGGEALKNVYPYTMYRSESGTFQEVMVTPDERAQKTAQGRELSAGGNIVDHRSQL